MLVDTSFNWHEQMSAWAFAYGQPTLCGEIKKTPEDFQVIEDLRIEPAGQGEHILLQITKQRQNTDTVAKALARHADVAYRDVGYSGLKDFNAVTQQWFSIYKPKLTAINWDAFDCNGVEINQIHRHNRKIKRGTHRANQFQIRIRNFQGEDGDLSNKIKAIKRQGVPNYFGTQRFGRNCNNMQQAYSLLVKQQTIKNRNLKSIVMSSARSWLFNCIVSERLKTNTWSTLYDGEPANLNGSNSVFNATKDTQQQTRLASLDIHPTAPMWGVYKQDDIAHFSQLHDFECSVVKPYSELSTGLEKSKLSYQRRPIRMEVSQLDYTVEQKDVVLSFSLQKGQYATSVLRELILS